MIRAKLLLASFVAAVGVSAGIAHGPDSIVPIRIRHAIDLAATVYRVSSSEMISVSRCETVSYTDFHNEYSDASGLFQFLRSTWARTPFAHFSRFDLEANALAAAWLVRQDGGWREWTCKP